MTGLAEGAPARVAGDRPAATRALVLAALGLLFIGFVALGSWQIERRSWKLALIARVEQRIHAPAVPAPGRERWQSLTAANDEYVHLTASGVFLDPAETFVQAVTERGAGFWLMTPLQIADGSLIFVNRGFVSSPRPTPTPPGQAERPVTVDGLLRLNEPGGGFLRRNDAAAGRWYSRDVVAMAAARGLNPVAPYFIDAGAVPSAGPRSADEPVPGLTVVSFYNNHLVYAVTWFGLALLVLAAGWQVTAEGRRRHRLDA